ncbi:DUF1579 family protein [Hyphobacterium sp.]|uniref:DUF1579 family protein n=1 Tax=Hyphobacterium sp. TaxID=2004662 RepID=UPI00374A543B
MKYAILACLTALCLTVTPGASAQNSSAALDFLDNHEGDWTVSGRMMTPDGWVETSDQPATIESLYDGRAYIERSTVDFGSEVSGLTTLISWDVFREVYRVAAVDESYGLLDVYEGHLDDVGRLSVTNLRADTYFPAGPTGEMHFRLSWTFVDEDRFVFEVDLTTDRGETWSPYFELTYNRAE